MRPSDSDASNGCETELTSLVNCGACGGSCSYDNAVADCSSGSCEFVDCQPGFGDCDATAGCETDVNTDADNWTADLAFGRELLLTADGTVEEFRFDARANNDGALRLAVTRLSSSDPWLVAGNGRTFDEATIAQLHSERVI